MLDVCIIICAIEKFLRLYKYDYRQFNVCLCACVYVPFFHLEKLLLFGMCMALTFELCFTWNYARGTLHFMKLIKLLRFEFSCSDCFFHFCYFLSIFFMMQQNTKEHSMVAFVFALFVKLWWCCVHWFLLNANEVGRRVTVVYDCWC